jgi:leucyl-tRNA synthetase
MKKPQQYDPSKIEKKWQKTWEAKKTYKTLSAKDAKIKKKKPFYSLVMFPYPSGENLHVGHPRSYVAGDIIARMKRMQGFNVLNPMGYDAFGLPAEQYAITHKIHPSMAIKKNVATFEKQLSILGLSYDWSRKVNTTDPDYYKWTQDIFLKLYDHWYDTEKKKARPIAELVKQFEKNGNLDTVAYSTNFPKRFGDTEWNNFDAITKQDVLMHYRLAYIGEAEVNWCEKLGTVLANDEIVDSPEGPVSERGGYPVEKMRIKQWFMRITAYADRLLEGLEGLRWSDHLKEIQKNWIGRSEGSLLRFQIAGGTIRDKIEVFTTRADTLFGVTYVVLSPEHKLIKYIIDRVKNRADVESYIEASKKKTTADRTDATKEKTGVPLEGIMAINPANNEEVPVWVADYVLHDYATGAVMAVPAHDERDMAFAKKFDLPIKQVIEPLFVKTEGTDAVRRDQPMVSRNAAVAIIEHWSKPEVLCLAWKKNDWKGFVIGGIEHGEDAAVAIEREIIEETGFQNPQLVQKLNHKVHAQFFHEVKNQNRYAHFDVFYYKLLNGDQKEISEDEKKLHDMVWVPKAEMEKYVSRDADILYMWKAFDGTLGDDKNVRAYTDDGVLVNSGQFDGMTSEEARHAITSIVQGKFTTRYKMRDAVFARQRYWGEPIPLMRDKDGLITPVKKLPLTLPPVKSYEPTGKAEGPLAGVKAWTDKGLETNTMPGWAGSSWYFLRYMDPKNKKAIASPDEMKYWKSVDVYVGGAEHATGHLLYSRFWNKFLFDLKIAPTDEPFPELHNQGMILGSDNRKMSKRWGNVVNPDDVVKTYGADSLRVFEMFLGPFYSQLPWSTDGIIGSRRFIEKVWKIAQKVMESAAKKTSPAVLKTLHKTIKKVDEDIASFNFNTAISAMMILGNEMEKAESIATDDFKKFLQILAPFAPHVTEELWAQFGEKQSINIAPWPKFDEKLIIDDTVTVAIQINGKTRGTIDVAKDTAETAVVSMAKLHPDIVRHLGEKEILKTIYVPNRLINFVVVA